MKKGLLIGACFLFILIVLMSFASAGFFSDIWGKITGKVTYYSICADSDSMVLPDQDPTYGDNPYSQGTFDGSSDYCTASGLLFEYYCSGSSGSGFVKASKIYNCAFFGMVCDEGACIKESITPTRILQNCSDSDVTSGYSDGKNYYKKGWYDNNVHYGDYCSSNPGEENILIEYYCTYDSFGNDVKSSVPYDCSKENMICDRDSTSVTYGACIAGCTKSVDCISEYECTTGVCNNGVCSYSDAQDGEACTLNQGVCCNGICCALGNRCSRGFCLAGCIDNDDCTIPGLLKCDTSSYECVECLSVDDCDSGEDCIWGDCVAVNIAQICGDGMCGLGETCSNCFSDCGYCYEQYTICEDCVGSSFTWCKDGDGICVSDTAGCADKANYDYECGSECVNGIQEYSVASLSEDIEVKKLINSLESGCGLNFEFNVLNTLPQGYTFPSTINRRVVKVLNITSDANVETDIDLVLNESELGLKFPIKNVSIYIEEGIDWTSPTQEGLVSPNTQSKVYTYRFCTPHFSLFLITEPDYCGNGVFESNYYEECDESVTGTTHCTACVCDIGYHATASGDCEIDITGTDCSPIGNKSCSGFNLIECDSNSVWEDEGLVIGECGVDCLAGNTSCQGEVSLLCASNYVWITQGKISGLCGYSDNLDYNNSELNRCGNGYCNYDEDEYSCPEDCALERGDDKEPNWALIILVTGIVFLILVIIVVLFKIFSREKRGPMPQPNRRLPPRHRPGPKRVPGRPLEHNRPVGRPVIGSKPYPRRRYPVR